MDLSQIVAEQISADIRRGFPVNFRNSPDRLSQLEQDLIGLVGEIGEFSNTLKKVRLREAHDAYVGPSLEAAAPGMREELADALIYLMRLSFVLGGDLENDLLAKMRVNDERYKHLER